MPYRDLEEAFDALHEESVEEFLRADAQQKGIPWHQYCYMYGIMGDAQVRRVKRHEVQYDPDYLSKDEKESHE